jgi:ATP-binding cassette subfamily C protein CydCD
LSVLAPADRRLLRESRAARPHLALAGLLGALAAALIVAQAALLAYVIDRAAMHHAALAALRPALLALAAVLLARAAVNGGFELSGRWGAMRVMSELRRRLAQRLLVDGVGVGVAATLGPGVGVGVAADSPGVGVGVAADSPGVGVGVAANSPGVGVGVADYGSGVAAVGSVAAAGGGSDGEDRTGALAAAAVQGVDALEAYFAGYLPQLVLAALVPLAVLGWVAPLDPVAAAILTFTVPLLILFMVLVGRGAQARTRRRWQALTLLSAHFLDVVRGLPTLRAYRRDHAQDAILAEVGERYRVGTMGTLRIAFLSALVLELCAMIGTALVAATIGVQLVAGALGLQAGLTVLLLAPELYGPLRQVGQQFHASADGAAAAERIFAVLDQPPALAPPAVGTAVLDAPVLGPAPVRPVDGIATRLARVASVAAPRGNPRVAVPGGVTAPDPGRQPIRFRGVRFEYPGRPGPVLDRVELELAPGAVTALVGPSGAGKSTLAALLMRLADPTAGAIECGGRDLRELPPERWREQIAWVPQEPTLFAGTLAENIALGRPRADPGQIARAADAAGARDLIEGLPQGIDTVLGDGARRLSAGQRRRVALARAFLRDAPLLVLDEPTAHLDEDSAADIARTIARLAAGRTVLSIVHHPALAARAARVVELRDGRIVRDVSPAAAGGVGDGRAAGAGVAGDGAAPGRRPAAGSAPETSAAAVLA